MKSICINGKMISDQEPVLMAANRSYRYGDGLFETMKMVNGKILLGDFHFERLFTGLSLLQFNAPKLFSKELLSEKISEVCRKNSCEQLARVRLSVSRGNGGLYDADNNLQYVIECWPLNDSVNCFNENGLVTGLYTAGRKTCDIFSNLKSASFLPYVMAALYARENKWNDCLLMNTEGNIADSTIANIFVIKNGIISTPAASQGCVLGVMRRYLLTVLAQNGFFVEEKPVTVTEIESADEVFLTNAINGIRWVGSFGSRTYSSVVATAIYNRFVKTIFF
ncbi:MAG: aminotransferase class IV [Chitinophagaceae bacterium]|nr:aminotransferase class IV [Chitinophagaceae bacterium]MBK8952440.1 aminotransferase class IV [Chitinophagaceae bacterium]